MDGAYLDFERRYRINLCKIFLFLEPKRIQNFTD